VFKRKKVMDGFEPKFSQPFALHGLCIGPGFCTRRAMTFQEFYESNVRTIDPSMQGQVP
jgi:hypothetical protein